MEPDQEDDLEKIDTIPSREEATKNTKVGGGVQKASSKPGPRPRNKKPGQPSKATMGGYLASINVQKPENAPPIRVPIDLPQKYVSKQTSNLTGMLFLFLMWGLLETCSEKNGGKMVVSAKKFRKVTKREPIVLSK